jgi:phenylacetate-CoA ligase
MHIFEDAFVLEVLDLETKQPKLPGERDVIYQTTLFKHLAPMIRFNSNDVSAFAQGKCPCGCDHRRLERIYGRSDNMVKLRGTNIFPEAIGEIISADPRSTGEYVCIVETRDGADAMTVMVEILSGDTAGSDLERDLAARLKESLGVRLEVQIVKRGQLDEMTGLSQTSKVRRLIDKRK